MKNFHKKLSAILNCGSLTFKPFVVLQCEGRSYPDYTCSVSGNALQLSSKLAGIFQDDLYLTCAGDHLVCRRMFHNLSGGFLDLVELGLELGGITFGGHPRNDYFYHNENPRIYETMTFPVDYDRTAADAKDSEFDIQAGNRWADPGVVCERIGRSPYQPFPAILVSNYDVKHGLVHGTLSQKVFYHNYLVAHEDEKLKLEIFSGFKAVGALHVAPGRILVDEWYLGTTGRADDIEKIFEEYTTVLRRHLPPLYGATDINRTSMVWGSWNDGICRDIDEKLLLEEAECLSRHFPTVKWVQVDDGYAAFNKIAHGLGAPYEGEAGIDSKKFPGGLRHYTDELRKTGLRPALWIGGHCPIETKIFQEHPEWFIDYSMRMTTVEPLDVSVPEVREYMTGALDFLLLQGGFEGVKHDFWSYAFEDSHALYRNCEHSGYELRSWWLSELRKRLAPDGYLQTGCDIVMGNPFLGEFFTNYRYGIDIGTGKWDYVKTNYLWGAACFATHTGDLFVPNSDSVGLFPDLNDTEAMFCINYCIATHSMVEIAGRLSQADPDSPRFKRLKKAVCSPNNGQDVFFARYDYRRREYSVPEILFFMTPHFSILEGADSLPVRTVGLFNVEDNAKAIIFSAEDLGIGREEYLLADIWSGEIIEFKDKITFEIEAHGSRLLAVSRKDAPQLLDADIRINSSRLSGNVLELETDYAAAAELLFNWRPAEVKFNGKPVEYAADGTSVSLQLASPGTLTIFF